MAASRKGRGSAVKCAGDGGEGIIASNTYEGSEGDWLVAEGVAELAEPPAGRIEHVTRLLSVFTGTHFLHKSVGLEHEPDLPGLEYPPAELIVGVGPALDGASCRHPRVAADFHKRASIGELLEQFLNDVVGELAVGHFLSSNVNAGRARSLPKRTNTRPAPLDGSPAAAGIVAKCAGRAHGDSARPAIPAAHGSKADAEIIRCLERR